MGKQRQKDHLSLSGPQTVRTTDLKEKASATVGRQKHCYARRGTEMTPANCLLRIVTLTVTHIPLTHTIHKHTINKNTRRRASVRVHPPPQRWTLCRHEGMQTQKNYAEVQC